MVCAYHTHRITAQTHLRTHDSLLRKSQLSRKPSHHSVLFLLLASHTQLASSLARVVPFLPACMIKVQIFCCRYLYFWRSPPCGGVSP
jgi:hypothetical protein